MRYIAIFIMMIFYVGASEVEVTADKFFADEVKRVTVFSGHVDIKKEKDELKADKVTINFDKNRQPIKYTATGNASVKMRVKGKRYFAKGEILIYEPKLLRYTIKKGAFLQELDSDKKVYGEVIKVDQSKGQYEVDSKKNKPVKFIFKLEDKKID